VDSASKSSIMAVNCHPPLKQKGLLMLALAALAAPALAGIGCPYPAGSAPCTQCSDFSALELSPFSTPSLSQRSCCVAILTYCKSNQADFACSAAAVAPCYNSVCDGIPSESACSASPLAGLCEWQSHCHLAGDDVCRGIQSPTDCNVSPNGCRWSPDRNLCFKVSECSLHNNNQTACAAVPGGNCEHWTGCNNKQSMECPQCELFFVGCMANDQCKTAAMNFRSFIDVYFNGDPTLCNASCTQKFAPVIENSADALSNSQFNQVVNCYKECLGCPFPQGSGPCRECSSFDTLSLNFATPTASQRTCCAAVLEFCNAGYDSKYESVCSPGALAPCFNAVCTGISSNASCAAVPGQLCQWSSQCIGADSTQYCRSLITQLTCGDASVVGCFWDSQRNLCFTDYRVCNSYGSDATACSADSRCQFWTGCNNNMLSGPSGGSSSDSFSFDGCEDICSTQFTACSTSTACMTAVESTINYFDTVLNGDISSCNFTCLTSLEPSNPTARTLYVSLRTCMFTCLASGAGSGSGSGSGSGTSQCPYDSKTCDMCRNVQLPLPLNFRVPTTTERGCCASILKFCENNGNAAACSPQALAPCYNSVCTGAGELECGDNAPTLGGLCSWQSYCHPKEDPLCRAQTNEFMCAAAGSLGCAWSRERNMCFALGEECHAHDDNAVACGQENNCVYFTGCNNVQASGVEQCPQCSRALDDCLDNPDCAVKALAAANDIKVNHNNDLSNCNSDCFASYYVNSPSNLVAADLYKKMLDCFGACASCPFPRDSEPCMACNSFEDTLSNPLTDSERRCCSATLKFCQTYSYHPSCSPEALAPCFQNTCNGLNTPELCAVNSSYQCAWQSSCVQTNDPCLVFDTEGSCNTDGSAIRCSWSPYVEKCQGGRACAAMSSDFLGCTSAPGCTFQQGCVPVLPDGGVVNVEPQDCDDVCDSSMTECKSHLACALAARNTINFVMTQLNGNVLLCDEACAAQFRPTVSFPAQLAFNNTLKCYQECENSVQPVCDWTQACPSLYYNYCGPDCRAQLLCVRTRQCLEYPTFQERENCFKECAVSTDGNAAFLALKACAEPVCETGDCRFTPDLNLTELIPLGKYAECSFGLMMEGRSLRDTLQFINDTAIRTATDRVRRFNCCVVSGKLGLCGRVFTPFPDKAFNITLHTVRSGPTSTSGVFGVWDFYLICFL
jgi:hypothetical protein